MALDFQPVIREWQPRNYRNFMRKLTEIPEVNQIVTMYKKRLEVQGSFLVDTTNDFEDIRSEQEAYYEGNEAFMKPAVLGKKIAQSGEFETSKIWNTKPTFALVSLNYFGPIDEAPNKKEDLFLGDIANVYFNSIKEINPSSKETLPQNGNYAGNRNMMNVPLCDTCTNNGNVIITEKTGKCISNKAKCPHVFYFLKSIESEDASGPTVKVVPCNGTDELLEYMRINKSCDTVALALLNNPLFMTFKAGHKLIVTTNVMFVLDNALAKRILMSLSE